MVGWKVAKIKTKHLKISTFNMENLPDEVILKVLFYLPIKDLIQCSQVSKRFKTISDDESLWQKINLYNKKVPAKFVEHVINKGCKYIRNR